MTAEPREELISAYLDGELSDDQRAEVEKWLAESSQLRRLHAELRAVRSGMQSLERHKLDHDISGAVLRRAEQAVLRGADSKPVPGTRRPTPTPASWWNRGAGWRRVVWPALAVAAALAILVYDANQRPAEREVARAPEQEEFAAAGEADQAVSSSGTEESVGAREVDSEYREAPALRLERAAGTDADDNRSREPTLEYRAAQRQRPQRMLKDLAKPGTVPAEPSFAPRSAPSGGSLDAPAAQLQVAGGLVLQCTPQFLRERNFEKLLDEKKIAWRRVAKDEKRQKDAEGSRVVDEIGRFSLGAAAPQSERVTYVVNGTREQVNGVLTELGDRVQRRGRVDTNELFAQSDRDGRLPQQLASGDKAGGFTITLVAPAPASGAAEPAAASPADESP